MPFVGKTQSGNIVLPYQVPSDAAVVCPSCDGEMTVRESYWNRGKHVSRHFSHKSGGEGCGGESPTHQKMKAIAGSILDDLFGIGDVVLEKQIGERIADIAIEFDRPFIPLGNGFVVECQYRHKDKNTGEATDDFFRHGFSVLWLYETDFDFDEMTYDIPNDRIIPLWPNAVPEPPGDDLYPETAPARIRRDIDADEPPGVVPAIVPPICRTIHQFDVESPVRGGKNPGWKRFEKTGIHTKGRHNLWVTIYGHERLGSFLEFRKIDTKTNENEWLPVPITPDDAERVRWFTHKAQNAIQRWEETGTEPGDGDSSDSYTESILLSYNAGLQGVLWFDVSGDEPCFSATQRSILGCERDLRMSYRSGDFERLSYICPSIPAVFDPQYPLRSHLRI